MKKSRFRLFALAMFILTLGACSSPETPEEVAEEFWKAVVQDDGADVVEYSTLKNQREYDRFSRDWSGMSGPTWGRMIIDGGEASIETAMVKADAEDETLDFETYLVTQDDVWLVDYQRTKRSVAVNGVMGKFLGNVKNIGKKISSQFEESAAEFNARMSDLTDEFSRLENSLNEKAEAAIEQYGEELRKHMNELADSIERALKEQDGNISSQDKSAMKRLLKDLEGMTDDLSNPDFDAIAEAGRLTAAARETLEKMNSRALERYEEHWQEWSGKMETDMKKLVTEIKSSN